VDIVIVALIGAKRSGKDTVGRILCEERGFARVSIADNIRAAAYALDPIIGYNLSTEQLMSLADFVDKLGWFEAQNHPEVRNTLQRMGREMVLPTFGEDAWFNLALKQGSALVNSGNVVITDFRYCHEVDDFHYHYRADYKCAVWMVERPGFAGDPDGHPSEHEWKVADYDAVITNDGTLEELETKVLAMYAAFELGLHPSYF
jgi:hypothetical protein